MSARSRRRPLEEIIAKREARRAIGITPTAAKRLGPFDQMPKLRLHTIHQKRTKR